MRKDPNPDSIYFGHSRETNAPTHMSRVEGTSWNIASNHMREHTHTHTELQRPWYQERKQKLKEICYLIQPEIQSLLYKMEENSFETTCPAHWDLKSMLQGILFY